MNILSIFLLASALSVDSLIVSITCGMQPTLTQKKGLTIALVFALMQGLFPLFGALFSSLLENIFKQSIDAYDHWIAFGLLCIIGLKMIWEARKNFKNTESTFTVFNPFIILSLAVATSIDALVVGISLGIELSLFIEKLKAILIIMLVTFFACMLGITLGRKNTFFPSKWATFLGGIVLILIGVKIVIEHHAISF